METRDDSPGRPTWCGGGRARLQEPARERQGQRVELSQSSTQEIWQGTMMLRGRARSSPRSRSCPAGTGNSRWPKCIPMSAQCQNYVRAQRHIQSGRKQGGLDVPGRSAQGSGQGSEGQEQQKKQLGNPTCGGQVAGGPLGQTAAVAVPASSSSVYQTFCHEGAAPGDLGSGRCYHPLAAQKAQGRVAAAAGTWGPAVLCA